MTSIVQASQLERLEPLRERAYNIRRHALRMAAVQGQGYVGQALDIADVLAVLYFDQMRYRPDNPQWEERDRLLLSIGHYAIALYAALIEAGVIPHEELETYGTDGSRLPMSGMAPFTPGMEISGGSLGHGLGIAVGMGLGLRRRGLASVVYNLLSDGELDEGSTWEAAMSAAHFSLDNLIAIVDVNNQQADAPSRQVLNFEPLVAKWEAFGWYTQRVNGNDVQELVDAFDRARHGPPGQPRVVLCDTQIGKGVRFLEQREKTHFIRVAEDEWELALQQLAEGREQ
jgi:transketolase